MMTESEAGLSSCCPECVGLLEVTDLALGGADQCPSSWARTTPRNISLLRDRDSSRAFGDIPCAGIQGVPDTLHARCPVLVLALSGLKGWALVWKGVHAPRDWGNKVMTILFAVTPPGLI